MKATDFLKLFPQAFKEWMHDRADGLAASIAFYQLLSIAPFVALIVLASSAVFGQEQYKAEVEPLISQFFHPQFITAIKYMLRYSFNLDEEKFFTLTVLAIASLIHGTLGYFMQIKDSIENFWNKRTEEVSVKARLKKMTEALFMAAVTFVLLMIGFIAGHWFHEVKGVLRFPLMFAVEFTVLFFIIFFLLVYCPPVKVNWKAVLPGTFITTLLYITGRLILGYILTHQNGTAEDVAAALILYLLWAYYSSMVFLFGAEFSKLFIIKNRKRYIPKVRSI